MQEYLNDISLSLAVAAHSGTSMTPERRGEAMRNDYAQTLQADYDSLRQQHRSGASSGSGKGNLSPIALRRFHECLR